MPSTTINARVSLVISCAFEFFFDVLLWWHSSLIKALIYVAFWVATRVFRRTLLLREIHVTEERNNERVRRKERRGDVTSEEGGIERFMK